MYTQVKLFMDYNGLYEIIRAINHRTIQAVEKMCLKCVKGASKMTQSEPTPKRCFRTD